MHHYFIMMLITNIKEGKGKRNIGQEVEQISQGMMTTWYTLKEEDTSAIEDYR